MDIRNIQKTGNMFYVYLPTSWCRKHHINSKSKVSLDYGDRNSLIVIPGIEEKKPKHLHLNIKEDNIDVLQKIVTSAYISPADSFKIELEKKANLFDMLSQKKFITFEPIELDENTISCESSIAIASPIALLNTMVTKIKNLITILKKTDNRNLIDRYEDEIDRIKVLIEKSVIDSLTPKGKLKLKATDLYYASKIATSLEQLTDYLRFIDKKDSQFLDKVWEIIILLKSILENIENLNHESAIHFIKKAVSMPIIEVKDLKTYDKRRIRRNLIHVSEALIDWAIVKEMEKTK